MTDNVIIFDETDGSKVQKETCYKFKLVEKNWKWNAQPLKDFFQKWNVTPDLFVARLKVDREFRHIDEPEIIKDLFRSSYLKSIDGFPGADICANKNFNIEDLKVLPLQCQATSMNFLEPLYREGIVADNGYIMGCYDQDIDGLLVQDKLRKTLANPESDDIEVFSSRERREFLYHILRLICLGGSMCQVEDRFDEWKEAIKIMYKELLCVQKNSSRKIEVTSTVYQIDPSGFNTNIFPYENPHNQCYCIFDKKMQTVTLLLKPYRPFW